MTTAVSTFGVSDVTAATEPLREVSYKEAVDGLLCPPERKRRLRQDMQLVRRFVQERGDAGAAWEESLVSLERTKAEMDVVRPVEACCRYYGRLLADVRAHPLIAALHRAFVGHRPICLSPDMIWLLIAQGVANHVNAHAETLRPRLVRHRGKPVIEIRRDDFIKGSPENPWGEVIAKFSERIRGHIGPTHQLFLPRFSTTGPVEQIAAEVVLLDAVKSYFEYRTSTLCGIPAITLEGSADDWETMAERTAAFAEFGLDWWLMPLSLILQEFAAAARGDRDHEFWRSIYKYCEISGGATVTGWITTFFPYLKDSQGSATLLNQRLSKCGTQPERLVGHAEGEQGSFDDGLSVDQFPSGLANVPFIWEYLGSEFAMEFLGGFVGIAQDAATLALRPEIGWAIRDVGGQP